MSVYARHQKLRRQALSDSPHALAAIRELRAYNHPPWGYRPGGMVWV